MSDPEDNSAVILEVGRQQSPCSKSIQLCPHWCWQFLLVDQPSDGTSVFIGCD